MQPKKRDITKYSDYFTIVIPNSHIQAILILLIGIFAGAVAILIAHYNMGNDTFVLSVIGASSGILVVSVPAYLTVFILKMTNRKMKLKHAIFAVLAISAPYAAFLVGDAVLYYFLGRQVLAYILLILANAGIYGYWLIINKIAVGQRKVAIITAQIQPLLNILLFIPFGGYLLSFGVPVKIVLTKLFAGILVFLAIGYMIIYLLDRPAKKDLYVSSVQLFSTMIGQWLYNLNADTRILGSGGVERDVEVQVMTLTSKKGIKAVIVKPDIHYGPFGTVGGSVFTGVMGNQIVNKYGASPFIMHGAVNIDDNPISTRQVYTMSNKVCEYVDALSKGRKRTPFGNVAIGRDGECRAINVRINKINILALTKAPHITEDIDSEVGMHFERIASHDSYKTMLVDAHNSRFETAPEDDLKGIYKGSKYIGKYENAIMQAMASKHSARMKFGSSHMRFSKALHNSDLGEGYSSLGIFVFGGRRYGILNIDANNILPGFRESVIAHMKSKYKIDMELFSTDTHSVNSIALTAKNSLGRYTKYAEIVPLLDTMMERALKSVEDVKEADGSFTFKNFKVWGPDAEALINKVGMDIINIGKNVVPIIIVAAFIIAGWIIYVA